MSKKIFNKSNPNKRRLIKGGAFGVFLAATVYAVYGLWWLPYAASHNPSPLTPETATKTVTVDTPEPDETPIKKTAEYTVPTDQPRRIMLPSIDKEGFVQRVGVDQTNAITVPTNIHLAGWFVDSVRPGEPGVSLIDGHVRGRYNDAIFAQLKDLKAGDRFQVEFGDRSLRSFEVVSTTSYSEAETPKYMLTPVEGLERQLNLITCIGKYDVKTETYDQRLVVVSKWVE